MGSGGREGAGPGLLPGAGDQGEFQIVGQWEKDQLLSPELGKPQPCARSDGPWSLRGELGLLYRELDLGHIL